MEQWPEQAQDIGSKVIACRINLTGIAGLDRSGYFYLEKSEIDKKRDIDEKYNFFIFKGNWPAFLHSGADTEKQGNNRIVS